MSAFSIFLIIVVILLLYVVISYVTSDISTLMSGVSSGTEMKVITPDSLAKNDTTAGNSGNYSYSIWFYVNDWNYKYGETKVIFGKMKKTSSEGVSNISSLEPCPAVTLDPIQNNLTVSVTCYPEIVHKCEIVNVPIQRWVNLFISVYGRSLDVYIDGKLVRTCILPGIAKVAPDAPIYLTPSGGFSGWTARFQYWDTPSDPQFAWDIYKKGYGGNMFGNFFGRYKIKLSLVTDQKETNIVVV